MNKKVFWAFCWWRSLLVLFSGCQKAAGGYKPRRRSTQPYYGNCRYCGN